MLQLGQKKPEGPVSLTMGLQVGDGLSEDKGQVFGLIALLLEAAGEGE